jgi:SAM-dependent methyltransferase
MPSTEWFGTWFDSHYYHKLYKNRDTTEAQRFIDSLASFLDISPAHKVLDLACGKGRHSIYLNQKGFDVEGVDLSGQSIVYAEKYANSRLHFAVHDMRQVYKTTHFDFIINLFTSFGYFDSEEEHIVALKAVAMALKPQGHFIIDFFNTYKVVESLVPYSEVASSGIIFKIERHLEDGAIFKNIYFTDEKNAFHFQERVRAFTEQDFVRFFEAAGLVPVHQFGSYTLSDFDKYTSDRMIFVVQKP